MSTSTQQRPARQRPRSAKSAKATRATSAANKVRAKQTARIEGLRDGKPLLFGWGKHLTRAQKLRYQHMAMWTFIGIISFAVIGTIVFGVINENILIPNQAIVTVNGTNISQDAYRKELAYQAQVLWNRLQTEIAQNNALQARVQSGDASAITQNNIVAAQLQADEANYAQAQITQAAVSVLEDNQLILAGEKRFEQQNHAPSSAFEPSQKAINDALAAFKKAFPNGETYAQFISADGLTNQDVINSITIQLRRANMQTYLAKQLVSPARQVEIRRIQVDTKANAASVRTQLLAGKLSDATWTTLAKKYSLDTTSKDIGGLDGWVPYGTGDGGIELWAYDASRKVGDLSPVIYDTTGTYDVVQIVAIDPSRAVNAATLKAAQDNALAHWLGQQRVAPTANITSANSTMLNATRNLPKKPSLSATLPAVTPTVSTGVPGLP